MRRSLRLRLEHIRHGIARIEQLTAGRTIKDYLADEGLREMVERNIARISEAARHIPEDVRTTYPTIPWRHVVGIGNVIRHDYDEIDHTVMWQKLLPLTTAVEAMLRDLDTKVEE